MRKSHLNRSYSSEPTAKTPDPLVLILQTVKAKQQDQLDDRQTSIDALSEDFATRAAAIAPPPDSTIEDPRSKLLIKTTECHL